MSEQDCNKQCQDKKEAVAKTAMFFAGLILLIPHRIGMSRVNYIIKRYNLPISRAGLLLYKFHNPIEVSLTIGNVLGVIITIITTAARDGPGNKARDFIGGCMIIVLSFMLLSSYFMLIIYIDGDDFGYLDEFYFSLIFITLFDGFTNAFAFCINATHASLYAAAIPTSGALVSLLHNIYKFYSDKNNWDDFVYYVLRVQLFYNIITIFITLILWVWVTLASHHWDNANHLLSKVKGWANFDDHWPDFSPICMLAFSLGTVYAFYPSIAPYSIIDYQYASVIELWILIISSSPTLLFAILDFVPQKKSSSNTIGPGACNYFKTSYSGVGNWSSRLDVPRTNFCFLWHLVWFCAIPYILCIQIFMTILHYPHSLLSCFFNKSGRIGFISVLFNTLRESMQACGFAGAGKQKINNGFSAGDEFDNINGTISSLNKPITLFVMMFCVFTGDGYLQHYRRCCRDYWPTKGYTRYRGFKFWFTAGLKEASKTVRNSFTLDIRSQFTRHMV